MGSRSRAPQQRAAARRCERHVTLSTRPGRCSSNAVEQPWTPPKAEMGTKTIASEVVVVGEVFSLGKVKVDG